MPHEEGHEALPEDQFLAELETLFASGATGLPETGILGGFYGGSATTGNPNLGGSGQNAPAGGRLSASEQPQGPRPYFEGDEFDLLSAMNTEQLARFQDTAVAVGLAREVIPGRLDDGTVAAMRDLMKVANRQAVEWSEVLDGIVASGGMVGARQQQYEPSPFLKPDYATLAQQVKAEFRQRLGREPDEYDLQQMTGELSGFYADEYAAKEEFRRIQHEAQTTPGVQGGGTVSLTDPMSRFREVFDERFGAELAEPDKERQAQLSQESVQGGARMVAEASRRSF